METKAWAPSLGEKGEERRPRTRRPHCCAAVMDPCMVVSTRPSSCCRLRWCAAATMCLALLPLALPFLIEHSSRSCCGPHERMHQRQLLLRGFNELFSYPPQQHTDMGQPRPCQRQRREPPHVRMPHHAHRSVRAVFVPFHHVSGTEFHRFF